MQAERANQRRILIVDDDEGIRRSLSRILRTAGHHVCIAKDGYEAIEVAKDFKPHLLLIDIRMPGIDGVETFHQIRDEAPSLAAIFMTAYASSEKNAEAEERGAISVLSKPLDVEHLLSLVDLSLEKAPILIAEDDPDLLRSIARSLEASGVKVETASTLNQAMRSLRQRPNRVVVADVYLKDGFGYELLDIIDRDSLQSPFILITGQSDWLTSDIAEKIAGRVVCFTKPLDFEKLIQQVNQ